MTTDSGDTLDECAHADIGAAVAALASSGDLPGALQTAARAFAASAMSEELLTAASNVWVSAVDQGGILDRMAADERDALYRGLILQSRCPVSPPVFHHRISAQHSGGVEGHLARAGAALQSYLGEKLKHDRPESNVILLALLLRCALPGIDARRLSALHKAHFAEFSIDDLRIPYNATFDRKSFRQNFDDLAGLVQERSTGLLDGALSMAHLLTLYYAVPSAFAALPENWAERALRARVANIDPATEEGDAARSLALRFGLDTIPGISTNPEFGKQVRLLAQRRDNLAQSLGMDVRSDAVERLNQVPRQAMAASLNIAKVMVPALRNLSRRPRLALCVSGQLRGFRKTWETWKPLLAGVDATVFVSSWTTIGHGTPDPVRYTLPFAGEAFSKAYKAVGADVGFDGLRARYPTLFQKLARSGEVTKEEVQTLYDTPFVELDDERDAAFNNLPNGDKMYLKIGKCHRMMRDSGKEFDLVLRIRPDKPISAVAFGWSDMIEALKLRPMLFCETALGVHYGAISMGDQVALGLPATVGLYADTYDLAPQIGAQHPYRMREDLCGHLSVAHIAWMHDVAVHKLPIKFGPFQEAEPLDILSIEDAIRNDVGGRMDAFDMQLINAIGADRQRQ